MKSFANSRKYLTLLLVAFGVLVSASNALTGYAGPNGQIGAADALVRIGNFAPFNDGNAAIRISIDSVDRVDDFQYGWSTTYLNTVPGVFSIEIFEAEGANSLLKSDIIIFEPGKRYTLLFIGNGVDQPFDIALIDDDLITVEQDAIASIAFGHFAPLSGNLTGTSIDIRQDNRIVVRNDIMYGQFDPTDTDQLTKEKTSYIITTASGARDLIDLQTFGYNPGDAQYLFLVGDGKNKRIRAYLYVNDGWGGFMTTDRDTAVFVSPSVAFANFYNDTEIAYVQFDSGNLTTSLLEWGQITPSTVYPSGEYDITVYDKFGEEILSQSVSIGLSETVIYAITKNNTDGSPMLVPIFGDYLETGVVPPRIRFVHMAPFTSGAFATLDVRQSNGLILEDDLGFAEVGAFHDMAEGEYTFNVTTREGDHILFDLDPITLKTGDNMTVFLIGDGKSKLIQTVVHVNNAASLSNKQWASPLGKLSLVHFAPTGVGEATNTRVLIDDKQVVSGFGFGDFHPAEPLISGQYEIKVFDEKTGSQLASEDISIIPSAAHLIILKGDSVNEPYEIAFYELDDDLPVNPDKASLGFGDFAIIPNNHPDFDGSQINLTGNSVDLFSGLTYGQFSGNVTREVAPATYELTYVDANRKAIPANPFEVAFHGGDNFILYSVGDGDRHPYGMFAMKADGSSGKLLNDITVIENETFTVYLPIIVSK